MHYLFVTLLKSCNSLKAFSDCLLKLSDRRVFPTNDELQRILKTANVYTKIDVRPLLDRMEMYLNKDYVHNENHSIEHIMPQTVLSHDELFALDNKSTEEKEKSDWAVDLGSDWKRIHLTYVHTIGNLSLTGYNSEYKNYRFTIKRDAEKEEQGMRYGYKYSSIHLSSSLAKCEKWGEEEILNRTKEMADIIIDIWKYPKRID